MVEIDCDSFQHIFTGHVSVIDGVSGCGFQSGREKTSLYNVLLSAKNSGLLKSNKELYFSDSPELLDKVSVKENDCFIVDECNINVKILDDLYDRIKRANAHLIYFGRIHTKQLQYGIHDVYRIVNNDNFYSLSPVFDKLQNSSLESVDTIVTEDAASVAGLYSAILGKTVIPACGKNNIWKKIKSAEYPLIIADEYKFTVELFDILRRNKSIKKLYLFLPASFEEILLDSVSSEFYRSVSSLEDAFDSEMFCEDQVKIICSKFNKKTVSDAMQCMLISRDCVQCKFCLKKSQVMSDLIKFYNSLPIVDTMKKYCYVIDVQSFRNENNLVLNQSSINEAASFTDVTENVGEHDEKITSSTGFLQSF